MLMFIGIIAVLVVICLLIIFVPGAARKVADWTGTTVSKVANTAVSIAGIGIGLMLVSFGVSALAVPVVGVALIVIGVAMLVFSVWSSGWFGNSSPKIPIDSKSSLNKVA